MAGYQRRLHMPTCKQNWGRRPDLKPRLPHHLRKADLQLVYDSPFSLFAIIHAVRVACVYRGIARAGGYDDKLGCKPRPAHGSDPHVQSLTLFSLYSPSSSTCAFGTHPWRFNHFECLAWIGSWLAHLSHSSGHLWVSCITHARVFVNDSDV